MELSFWEVVALHLRCEIHRARPFIWAPAVQGLPLGQLVPQAKSACSRHRTPRVVTRAVVGWFSCLSICFMIRIAIVPQRLYFVGRMQIRRWCLPQYFFHCNFSFCSRYINYMIEFLLYNFLGCANNCNLGRRCRRFLTPVPRKLCCLGNQEFRCAMEARFVVLELPCCIQDQRCDSGGTTLGYRCWSWESWHGNPEVAKRVQVCPRYGVRGHALRLNRACP